MLNDLLFCHTQPKILKLFRREVKVPSICTADLLSQLRTARAQKASA
jgi:hypothetical protein